MIIKTAQHDYIVSPKDIVCYRQRRRFPERVYVTFLGMDIPQEVSGVENFDIKLAGVTFVEVSMTDNIGDYATFINKDLIRWRRHSRQTGGTALYLEGRGVIHINNKLGEFNKNF